MAIDTYNGQDVDNYTSHLNTELTALGTGQELGKTEKALAQAEAALEAAKTGTVFVVFGADLRSATDTQAFSSVNIISGANSYKVHDALAADEEVKEIVGEWPTPGTSPGTSTDAIRVIRLVLNSAHTVEWLRQHLAQVLTTETIGEAVTIGSIEILHEVPDTV